MMILDLNNVMFSTLLGSLGKHTNIDVDQNLLRHMILNVIRSINVRFRAEYGELIIAADSREYWRRKVFPYYKASRKKNREKSELNWPEIFNSFSAIKQEMHEFLPYSYLEIVGAEADDIIGTICLYEKTKSILVISGDKDFKQLHADNVKQYDPIQKKIVDHDPTYLTEHIIKGDAGDGIPNVASADNVFVVDERQRKITKKLLTQLTSGTISEKSIYYRNYMRNKTLIDLTMIPQALQNEILDKYKSLPKKDKSHLMTYFMDKRLKNLMEAINDF